MIMSIYTSDWNDIWLADKNKVKLYFRAISILEDSSNEFKVFRLRQFYKA